MTYLELQELVAAYLQRSDLTAQIPGFIERTRLRIGRKLRARSNLVEGSVIITDGDGTVPTGFAELVALGTTAGVYLRPAGARNFSAIRQGSGSAYVYRIDDKVRVAPRETATFTLSYFKYFPAFTAGSDDVPEQDMFLNGAVSEGFMYVGDMASAVPFKQLFDEAIMQANRSLKLETRPVSTYQRYDSTSVAL